MVLKQPRGPGDGPTPDYVGVSWSRTWNKVLGVGRIKAYPTSHDTAAKLYTTSYDPASPTRDSPPSGPDSSTANGSLPKLTIKLLPKPTVTISGAGPVVSNKSADGKGGDAPVGALKRKRSTPVKLPSGPSPSASSTEGAVNHGEGAVGPGKRARAVEPGGSLTDNTPTPTGGTFTGTAESLLKALDTL